MVSEIYTYNVRVCIGSEPITMELDTGASISTISEKVYHDKLSRYKLCSSNVKLRAYTGDRVPVLGSIKVPVRYNSGESQNMEVLVVKGDRPSLFGRDWLAQIRLDWKGIFRVSESPVESEFMGASEWPEGFAKFLKEKANTDYSGESDLSTPSMDTEHTPVETKTQVRLPNISQRPTPIKTTPAIAALAVVTTRSGRVIRPAKKLSL